MTLLATIDRLAEHLERSGYAALAAVLDTVSQELDERTAENEDEAEAVTASTHASDATLMLKNSGARIFDAVKQYGAKQYAVTGDGIQITLDRGDVQTETAFGFYSQDETGKPQLRVTFTCGSDRMVRWASLDSITGEALVQATQHVFGTGENYGAGVVTASTQVRAAKPSTSQLLNSREIADNEMFGHRYFDVDGTTWMLAGGGKMVNQGPTDKFIEKVKAGRIRAKLLVSAATANLELVDAVEQRVHDAALAHTVANLKRALRPFSKSKLQRALPLLDSWTARHVTRHLRAS